MHGGGIKANLETWQQDPLDSHLWVGENGLMINTAALDERSTYYEVVRILTQIEVVTKPVNENVNAAF